MRGRLYIDGIDVFLTYGVYVVQGGWNSLLAYPPLKTVTSNDWQEEDGIEADLSAPVLNTRDVTLKFAISGADSRYGDFLTLLGDRAYHEFRCEEVGRSFRLRLVSHSSLETAPLLGFLSVKFADDFPMFGYTYAPPVDTGIPPSDAYTIDGVPFSEYGVRVLQGSLSEVLKGGAAKQALLRNIPTLSGAVYDSGANVTYKTKDVKLTCLLRADDTDTMWRNYYALLHDLVQPDERLLGVAEIEQEFACYYKSCSVSDFDASGRVWLQFTLTLTFTGSYRIDEDDMVLASEDGIIIFTEDDENAIDVRPNRFAYPTMRLDNIRLTAAGMIRLNN